MLRDLLIYRNPRNTCGILCAPGISQQMQSGSLCKTYPAGSWIWMNDVRKNKCLSLEKRFIHQNDPRF